MRVTLKDVARRAGVSVPTVSLIVNGRDLSFREETRQAVHAAVAALNYRPDSMARRNATRSDRRDAVALLLRSESNSRVANSPSYEFICGVNDVLMERSQFLVMVKLDQLGSADDAAGPPPRVIAEHFVDGLIVETGLPAPLAATVARYGIPTIWLNSDRHEPHDCVYPDEEHAGRVATEHLLALGHRRVIFVMPVGHDNPEPHFSVTDRRRGYERAMRAARLAPLAVHERPQADPGGGLGSVTLAEVARTILESRSTADPITAIVTYGLVQAARLRDDLRAVGLACPADVSITASEDVRVVRRTWPEMAGVTCDRYQMGRRTAELMLEKIASGSDPQPSVPFRGTLVPGQTTGPRNVY